MRIEIGSPAWVDMIKTLKSEMTAQEVTAKYSQHMSPEQIEDLHISTTCTERAVRSAALVVEYCRGIELPCVA